MISSVLARWLDRRGYTRRTAPAHTPRPRRAPTVARPTSAVSPAPPEIPRSVGQQSVQDRAAAMLGALSAGDATESAPVVVVLSHRVAELVQGWSDGSDAPRIRAVGSAGEAEAAMDLLAPDALLLDLDLARECEALLRAMAERRHFAVVPVLAVREAADAAEDAAWRRRGVDDTLPRDGELLQAALLGHVEKRRLLARWIRRDPLTEMADAATFREHLEAAAALAAREQEPLSLALVDIDGMEALNARLGRAAADEVLRRVAAALEGCLRRSDHVARWRGGTFAVLLPKTGRAGAVRAMGKVLRAVRRSDLLPPGAEALPVQVSVGVVQHPARAATAASLAAAARLLAQAKVEGGDRVASAREADAPPGPPRILLAEGDEVMVSVIRHRLQRAGYEVVHVRDGEAMVRLAPKAGAALAIVNIEVPGLDGFQVLQRLRRIRSLRGLPIVMLAGTGRDADVVRGFHLGADDFLIRPFSPAELAGRVQRLLERV